MPRFVFPPLCFRDAGILQAVDLLRVANLPRLEVLDVASSGRATDRSAFALAALFGSAPLANLPRLERVNFAAAGLTARGRYVLHAAPVLESVDLGRHEPGAEVARNDGALVAQDEHGPQWHG